jgi:hypothetical protein
MSVFTAMVVPCTTVPISAGSMPCSRASSTNPARTAAANSCGVEGTLSPVSVPVCVSKTLKSVKVPPMSMPSQ